MTWRRPGGVHGLVDRVRDGVLLVVLRQLRSCEHAAQVPETGTVCNCAEDREDSSVQFFGKVVQSPLLCNDRYRV